MRNTALFTLGLITPLLASVLLPHDARATSCGVVFTGEQALLTPTARTIDMEDADLSGVENLYWSLTSEFDGTVEIRVENNEVGDTLILEEQ